jgi:amino acid adenylation domain-containing protein
LIDLERLGDAVGFSAAQRELLQHLLRERSVELPVEEGIRPRPDPAERPLSFAQQRLWFLHRLDPASPAYNMPAAVRLTGRLDVAALRGSLAEVVRRHEVLRTALREEGGAPVPHLAPAAPLPLPVVDLSSLSLAERTRESERLAREEARRPFDLGRAPLLRGTLVRQGDGGWLLLLTLHHVVGDGWSIGVLVRELGTLYEAFAAGRPLPLPELSLQYTDFAFWQRGWLAGEELERQLGFWREAMAGAPVTLELPADRPRPPVASLRGGRRRVELPAELAGRLRTLGQERGATLFMVLLATFAAQLARWSGAEDLVVGSPIANRNRAEIEGLVGFFVNTLPLRVDLKGDPAFRDLLDRVRETTLAAYSHQDLPFERLVEELRLERSPAHSPLFQVLFALQNAPVGRLDLEGLSIELAEVDNGAAKVDLELSLEETARGIEGTLTYSLDTFEPATAERLLGHWQTLLRGAVEEPGTRIWDLPLLDDRERQQLLEWSRTGEVSLAPGSIQGRFEAWVERTPEAVALVWEEGSFTYRELDRRANLLACHLLALGLEPEDPVGICFERSPDLVVCLLAALKAGGAYLPLEPGLGDERLEMLLSDAQGGVARPVVLTRERWAGRFSRVRERGGSVLLLDGSPPPAPPAWEAGPEVFADPDRLAYISFTSGSTGRPKGVAVPHRGVLRLVHDSVWARMGPDEVFLQLAPASFDASTLEIWGPLLNGGRLVIFPPHPPSLEELGDVLARFGVTTLWLTAGLFHQMVDGNLRGLASLRQLLAGGDALAAERVARVLDALPGVRLVNGYGPTEGTTFTCCWPAVPGGLRGASVPLGRPIANSEVHLLDRSGQPAPIGVPGELWIGGDGLARGYVARPDQTADRFRPHPFGPPGARLYRTGDLARYRPDGLIEFLGRTDHQVKIRGFRVEPGEIEAVLCEHPAVRQAAVVARGTTDDRRLVAYVVREEGAEIANLRDHLRRRLPEFMIPAAFVELAAFPLTLNGKLDRRALPEPDRRTEDEGSAAPRTPVEELLATLFADLLGIEGIGIQDDFFLQGGHSLLATRVVSRVREVFGVEIPLVRFFESPTVAGLAAVIAEAQGVSATPMVRVPRSGELPLSFAQQRLWFLEQLAPGSPLYNMPLAVRTRGGLRLPALAAALREIVRRHEALRTRFPATDGSPVQVVAEEAAFELAQVDLSALAPDGREIEARRLLAGAARRPFDLAMGPLLRALLLRLDEDEAVLFLNLHHIVADGWSIGVLLQELSVLYRGSALPELPLQYADFAAWQRSWLSGEVLDGQIAFWRDRLGGVPVLDLPTDRPRPPAQSFRGAVLPMSLPPGLADRVADLGRRSGVTPFMALLAAFSALLARVSGQDDLAVGAPIANRNRAEIEGLIGFFVNTLALRVAVADDPVFADLLARVRDATLEAYAHQDLPFERLVEELAPQRDHSRPPLVQAVFALQNAPLGPLELPGVTLEAVPVDTGTAKFDLTLALSEEGGGLAGGIEYATDLFDEATVRRLWDRFERLLAGAVDAPERRTSDLPLLDAAELHQILSAWSGAEVSPAGGIPVVRLFEDQVLRAPRAPAVVDGDGTLTYGDLDRRAGALATLLRLRGVGPEAPLVAVCCERSADLVVAVLAVLEAGGAYLPLDPAYPAERLSFMLGDAGVRLLLTHERVRVDLPPGVEVLRVDRDPGFEPLRERPVADPRHRAYAIYTSGSTGRPKGTELAHAGLANLAAWHRETYGLTPDDRCTLVAGVGFDASVWEIWPALTAGASLWVPPAELLGDPAALLAWMAGQGVTVSFLSTPMAEAVLAVPPPPGLALRFLLTGGDRLHRRAPSGAPFTLVNHYGPTEGTVVTTAGPVGPGEGPPSLGRPISGVRTWVMDGRLAPVPAGTPGELCVAGVGLARGYLGRPDLTAEQFRPDPLGGVPGERLYRTGDLVRWRPDGELEFLGRIDHQVKVRGVRIELGEIEAVLAEHPGVRAAAAAVSGGRLAAWYVADPEISPRELREHLRRSLPDSMLPSDFVRLDGLPLTANGKVDRQALPAPGPRPGEGRPKNAVEEVLAAIWEEVLGVRGIEPEDDFFALGGHSLLATRVLARMRGAFGVELPLSTAFEASTLEELAERIAAVRRNAPAPDGEPLRPVPRDGELPLSPTQERLWFLDQFEPGSAALNIPASACLRGRLDAGALESALAEVVRRHESLRTSFGAAEGRPYQRVAPPAPVFLPLVDLSGLPDRSGELARLEAVLAGHAFDLGRGPLWIAQLVRLAPDEHAFLLCLHHVIADGWSMGVLFRELGELYQAFSAGRPSPLAEPALQVADFAVWQRRWLAEGALDAQLAFWRQRLAGELTALDLPLDHPRPPVRTFRGSTRRLVLPPDLSDALRVLGRREGATLFMTLLAAFDVLLSRLSGQRDILVGTPIAGRTRAELEGLIGCFLNTLVLRADLSGEPSFRDLLARVREVCLSAYEHQDLPFETLLAELVPERDLSRTPLFQVFLNMLNLPPAALRLPDLEIVPQPLPDAPSKFDLTLYVSNPEGEIGFDLVFNADLLSPARIEEMLRQYELVLRQIADAPERGVEALSLVTAEARSLLPDPRAVLSDRFEGSVPQVFSGFARREPAALAAADGAEEWTYGELAAQSWRLARFLVDAGVLPGEVVAIYAHRSAPLVWALLGVLEAGAAFLILDPTYPAARQIEMLRLAQPRAWLEIEAAGDLPVLLDRKVWSLGCRRLRLQAKETGNPALSGFPAEPPDVPVGPDDLAYVAFTSGSTGGPKGVLGRHGSLSHFLPWLFRRFDLTAADRFSLLSGLSHDPLHRDVFTPLQLGAAVLLPDPDRMASPGWLAGWARRQGITVAHMTPAMAQLLTTEPPDGEVVEVTSLRYAFLVGESLTWRTVERLRRLAPAVTCVNLYGATETQRAVGCHVAAPELLQDDHRSGEVLPLGRGMEDVQLLVLGGSGELAGVGELGEILVRSPHLALGYLGDPERTRERFRENPFTGEAGDRLYRTGDLGRYLPDGEVAFAGRADSQVKVRGFRVEPGEIEAALARHSDVREAAVLVWEDGDDRRFLAAYLVPVPGRAIAMREVRGFLEERLPAYMVPAAYVVLDELPLTPNRKLDHRALPRPEVVRTDAVAKPEDPAAEVLAGIWADLLGLERVGVSDNFFELGGHSLLATRLLSRVRQVLGVELSLQELFEAPTVAGMAAAVARSAGAPSIPPLRRADRTMRLPLSFAQQRLWFLDRFEPGSPLYNIVSAFRVAGPLDVTALASALREIVRRHETLRTSFASIDGRPVQVVSPEARLDLAWTSLAALPPAERAAELRRLLDGEARRPFDLGRGPLFRARLYEESAGEWIVLLSIHHIVSDGWSMGVLLGELSVLYGAALEGAASPLPELPVQYADFAVWQRSWLQGEVLEAQLAWWREQLGDGPAPLELPTDRPRPVEQSSEGGTLPLALPAALAAEIQTLARRQGATVYMVLLAALQTLLHRYSGQEDIATGSPIANRTRIELEGLVGFFANTLVMRGRLSAHLPFLELLARLRSTVLEAHAHQDLPFEKLVEELAPVRDLGRSPLFQVMLVLQNTPWSLRGLPGLEAASLAVSTASAKFDLTWSFAEAPTGGLVGSVELRSDLWDDVTVRRMLDHFAALLEAALVDPGESLGALPLLSPAERLQMLEEWSGTAVALPPAACIHQLVEEQAARAPEALAVVAADRSKLSYRDLNERANQVAHFLGSLGIGPEDRVGICAESSPELLLAILGTLKAGAAYVPLDPAYPRERLAFMAQNARLGLLLVRDTGSDLLPAGVVPRVALGDWEPFSDFSRENPVCAATGENLAYVIYTSGSTGRPKGVAMPHLPLVNLIRWQQRSSGGGRTVQFSSLSFDVSFQEIFSTWSSGETLVLLPEGARADAGGLLSTLADEGVERLFLPFVALQNLAEWASSGEVLPRRLREVVTAGEQLKVTPAIMRLFERLPGCSLENQYGPSESHVVTAFRLPGPAAQWAPLPPIGRPVDNARLFILDPQGNPVPVGVPGELCIGGISLARGYLGLPEATAARFVPDPFTNLPGGRLYRTGDLAVWMPDGNLQFLGRTDHQIKVRGYRVELGEIEVLLSAQPGVHGATVVAREDATEDRRLVAYVVPETPGAVSAEELHRSVATRLPEYMLPSAWVFLETFPLTQTGKVDRRALPAPAGEGRKAPSTPPRTPLEETLAGIWSEILGTTEIGIHDNFFDLGGHSLRATRVLSRIRDAFGVEVPVRRLFARPTIAGLAEEIRAARHQEQGLAMPPLVRVPREGDLPLSFAQQRLWFLDRFDPGNPAYNIPAAFRFRGPLDRPALEASLGEIVRRHEVLRTSFQEREREPVQVIAPPGPFLLPQVDLATLPADLRERELERLVGQEAFRSFDLSRGPLLRACLFGQGEGDHALTLVQHHAVTDGWSQGVLSHELSALYEAFTERLPSPLAELPVQYADFAVWQRAWLAGEGLRAQLSYWTRQLDGIQVLDLPTDHPRPPVATPHGAARPFAWPAELGRGLQELSEGEGATLFMGLLAALQALLGRYSGQEDVVVGSPVANRNRSELEGLIGFFVNMLALRGDLSGAPSFRELLARVRETALEAYAHQDLPFDRLVEELQPDRDTSRSPVFQVAFQLFNVPIRPLELRGVAVSWLPLAAQTAKFDLNLSLVAGEQGLLGSCEHRRDLFEAATIDRMMGHLRVLLEGAVADPERRIVDLPVLSEAEQLQLVEWLAAAHRGTPESRAEPEPEFVAPRGPIETALAALWADLLGVERIGVNDSFFELGGHSLLATRLVNRVRETFGADLLLRDLFQAPTVAALARAIAGQKGGDLPDRLPPARLPVLRPDPERRHEPFPLTDVQQAYWIGRSGIFELGNVSTHVYLELETTGLDLERLGKALRRMIERHDMLRMVVLPDGRQRVLPTVPDYEIAVQEGDPESLRQRMSHQVLPAHRWPLFDLRASLLDGGRTRLHVSLDALVADAWSFRIMARELVQLYRDPGTAVPPLEITFRDYVLAEIELRASDLYRRSEEYWRGRLASLPPAPELPLAKSPGAVSNPRFVRRSGRLEPQVWQRLRAAGARRGLTPSGLLLAAFSEVLAVWSKSPRFTLTLTLFQRLPLHPQVAEIVGDFTSVTLLAVDAPRDVPLEIRAQRLQERLWMDLDHDHVSGVRILRELGRTGGGQSWAMPVVFTSTLALERPAPPETGETAEIETVYSITQTPQVWLDHQVSEQGGALVFFWDAVDEIFPQGLVDDMFATYSGLLARLADDEGLWQAERLALVPPTQLAQRADVNATATPGSGALLQTLFQEQARLRPEEPAVIAAERSLTYRELECRALCLGARLRALGARPNRLVAIAMEKGWEQVVAALAVVSSGAAYLPVDPELPRERFRYLLEHGEVEVALTQSWLEARLAWPVGVRRIPVDREDGEAPASLPPVQGREDLAYVIFTSGSTGVPKGVMIDHRGAVNTVLDIDQRFGVGPGDRVLALSSLSFDLSVWDVFGLLAAGGAIVLPEPGAGRDPSRWLDLLRQSGVTVWNSVPALLEMLVEYAERNGERLPASLRLVLLSGDWIPVGLPDRLRRLADHEMEIVSLGGATEASIWSIYHPIGRVDPGWKSIPYGRPLANQTFHVLDDALEPRPVWVPGQLHIGGIGLAQGYWRDPEKTAACFFVHPRTGERLYRTGDLGRYLPDGTIEFLGREDFQVKIQGYRIELGDVEAALAQHPGIAAGVTVALGDERGAKRLVAYFVPVPGSLPGDEDLRAFLAGKLPAYMVPAVFVPLESLPLTDNGKVDRKALPAPPERGRQRAAEIPRLASTGIEGRIAALWREVLQLDEVSPQESFFALGGNSILMVQVHARLQDLFGEIPIVDLFQYPTVRSLAAHLASRGAVPREQPAEARRPVPGTGTGQEVAIIGMAGCFPRAESLESFWRNLRQGVECISFFSDEELLAAGFSPDVLSDPRCVKARAILEGADRFDASFFGLTPRQAVLIDPQHRVFLECAWDALENAGYDPETCAGEIGVFAGASLNTYLFGLSAAEETKDLGNFQVVTGNDKDYLATRVSYLCNLRGPSLTVQTACSTSLVAIHLACRSLVNGECDMALAGGVSISAPQKRGYLYSEGGTGSPDGHCRAFDARAQGTVSGEGVGIVVLKRLADALADGDRIEAVILGSAINNDGSSKVGYTAPSVGGQAAVITRALQVAGVSPETISYVEAHGTGTPLGDPIEITALTQAFRRQTGKTGFCAIGSVKTNIGHLDAAAGVAGLIKTVLALRRGEIPPSLGFERPNPRIAFQESPFYVNQRLAEWRANGTPRRAGVSSFGFGGTNAHVVLEEAPPASPEPSPRSSHLLVLSARTPAALDRRMEDLAAHLENDPVLDLADVAWTLQVGRRVFGHRAVAVCTDARDAVQVLRSRDRDRLLTAAEGETDRPVAFLFPGQGARPAAGLAALHRGEPAFRQGLDRCAEILRPSLGVDLRSLLLAGESSGNDLGSTALAQPVLFAIEHSLAELWMAWGVRPNALLGHSLGEYVAACLSGVLSLEDALRLVVERGRLMQALPEGAMLAVPLPPEEVEELAAGAVSLAAINAPARCVLSGPAADIDALAGELASRGVSCRRLEVERAFHSRDVEAIQPALTAFLRQLHLQPPRIPFVSCLTGTWITDEEATDPAYWARQMRAPVRFTDAVDTLLTVGPCVLLEVGPGSALVSLARLHPKTPQGIASLAAAPAPDAGLLAALGRLWLAGVRIDWRAVHAGERRGRVALPSYPFERSSYWFETRSGRREEAEPAAHPANGNGKGSLEPNQVLSWEPSTDLSSLEEIVSGQLEIMLQQLDLLR